MEKCKRVNECNHKYNKYCDNKPIVKITKYSFYHLSNNRESKIWVSKFNFLCFRNII